MPVIAFVGQKGGSGKTSTSMTFAAWLVENGMRVRVIDSDPQRSALQWSEAMSKPIDVQWMDTADDLLEQIPDIAETVDCLVVDGAAKLSETTRAILLGADLAVLPVQPTGLDLQSAYDAIRLIRQARKVRGRLPKAALFLNRAIKGTRLKIESLSALRSIEDMTILSTVIHQRQAVADAPGQGLTVFTMAGKGAEDAVKEYRQLFKEIMEALP